MPNKRYQKGARLERKLRQELELQGFTCTRSAGSKSPWDIIAVPNDNEPVRLYQVKGVKTRVDATRLVKKFYAAEQNRDGFCYQQRIEVWVEGEGWFR